jgi:hypothetical protein
MTHQCGGYAVYLCNVFVVSAIQISKGTFLCVPRRVLSVATCIRIDLCPVGSSRKPEVAGPALIVRNLFFGASSSLRCIYNYIWCSVFLFKYVFV